MSEADGATIVAEPETTSEAWYPQEYSELVKNKGWDTPGKFLESYKNIESGYSQRVKLPTPESSAEEIRAFYQKTGCPENPDGYEIQAPEEVAGLRDEAMESILRQVAHEQGVPKQAFESLFNKYYGNLAEGVAKGREYGETKLREDLGEAYDEEVAIAQRFCAGCSDPFKQLLETTYVKRDGAIMQLGNIPEIVKEFISLGKKTLSDNLIKGEPPEPETDENWQPAYPESPSMYQFGDDEESKRARAWFKKRGIEA